MRAAIQPGSGEEARDGEECEDREPAQTACTTYQP